MHVIDCVLRINKNMISIKEFRHSLEHCYRFSDFQPYERTQTDQLNRVANAQLETMAIRNVFEIAIWRMTIR